MTHFVKYFYLSRIPLLACIFLLKAYMLFGQCNNKTFHLARTMEQEVVHKLNFAEAQGIQFHPSAGSVAGSWSVEISVSSVERFAWNASIGALGQTEENTNARILLYETSVTQNNYSSSTNYNSNGNIDQYCYKGGSVWGWWRIDNELSNTQNFVEWQLRLYDQLYHEKHVGGWFTRVKKRNVPVDITVKMTGNITTADIESIRIPGIAVIDQEDIAGNHYPLSEGLNNETIYIKSVSFALQKDVSGGTYESVWGNWAPGTTIPPLSTMPQRPYRVELKTFESGPSTGGGYTHHGSTEMIGPIYAKNSTESAQGYQINATIRVNNPNSELLNYAIWIDYEQNALSNCQNFLGTSELVASGNLTQNIVNAKFELKDNAFFGFAAGDKLQTRLRLSVKKGTSPSSTEIFNEGEVEDFVIQFNSSRCATGAEIPYDYAIYAEEQLPYCGVDGYKYTKDIIDWDYRTDPATGLFEIGEVKNIPYALSKFGKTAYKSTDDFLASLAQLTRPHVEYEVVDPVSGELVLNPDLDPLQNPAYRKLMWATTYTEETDPSVLADQILYQDIYYPVPEYDRLMTELKELPLIILMAGGGFMWQCRNYAKTRRIARWFARRGYVVAVIDYRQGTYFEKDMASRAIIRAWQDSRTAVKWWHSSGFDQHRDASNNPLWKIDLDRIYGAGGSAGAITMMHNAALTPELLDEAIRSGLLRGIGAGYAPPIDWLEDQWESNPEYVSATPTYDLRDYESIPCLPTSFDGITTCDLVNTSTETNPTTGKPYWGEPAAGIPNDQRVEFQSLLMNYKGQPARVEKTVSLAGALVSATLLTHSDDWRPILDIHHKDDGVVAAGTDYFFGRFSGDWFQDNMIWFIQSALTFEQLKGGQTLKRSVQGTNREDRFQYVEFEGPEKSAGWPHYHQVAFKWGGATYGEYGDAYDDLNPEATDIHRLEPKVMLLADAFLTGVGNSGGADPLPPVSILNYLDEPVLHLEDNTTDLAPLHGISTNTGRGGYATTTTTKASGLASFQLLTSSSRITLDENKRFIHSAFTERTVSFWVKPTQSTGIQDIYDEGGATNGFGVRLNNGVIEIAARNNGVQADLVSSHVLPTHLWTHVTAVFELGRLKLYLNGEQDTNATSDTVMFTQVGSHGNAAGFGATEGNSNAFGQINNNFIGWLDNLKIYNTTPEPETTNLMQLPDELPEAAPVDKVTGMLVYPNPISGVVNLSFDLQAAGTVSVRIINLAGQQVYQQSFGNLDQGPHSYELSDINLPSSTYILEVTGPSDRWVEKLMVRD